MRRGLMLCLASRGTRLYSRIGTLGANVSITNPDFETGNTTGWSTVIGGAVGITGSVSADNTTAGDGSYSCKIVLTRATGGSANGYARLTQNVTLEANTYYQFRLKVKGPVSIYRLIEVDAGQYRTVADVLDTAEGEWRSLLLNIKTGTDVAWQISLYLQYIAENTTVTAWVDSLVIQKIDRLAYAPEVIAAIGDSQVSHLGLDAKELNDNSSSFLLSSITRYTQNTLRYVTPLNKGIAGNTSAQVLGRVQADIVNQTPKPTRCYVAVGTNDAATSINVATFKNNIKGILQILKAGGVTPILFTITPRRDATPLDAYNTAITEAATEESVTLFDAKAIFDAYADWATVWMDDDVHYNRLGHLALGKAVGDLL